MSCFVRHIASKVTSYDAMPRRVVLLVEFFLNEGGDVLLNVVLLERLSRAVDGVLLHLLRHVCILDHSLPVRHFGSSFGMNTLADGRAGERSLISNPTGGVHLFALIFVPIPCEQIYTKNFRSLEPTATVPQSSSRLKCPYRGPGP